MVLYFGHFFLLLDVLYFILWSKYLFCFCVDLGVVFVFVVVVMWAGVLVC